ncbi:signal peptide peptidase SppA, 67K type [Fibrella aestuarina BUZ 2]|uniref:Signal peptide peptidase SppA, 67K type n=1 Tax=Fibrella aestuarina BUZ 2 TaxID=1166018 RepID=I0K9T1_9BACT|nr:signal peptide peptidase SppA [Fibrella aestuarina]CCH00884.1 signal peptide peptidase SppA, 67K type [Fibrella aestuarina BUZ 2]
MRQFLKYLLATLLGLVIFTLLGILIFAGIIGAASSKGDVTVADNSVLKIKLDEPIRERSRTNPFASFSGGDDANVMGLVEIKEALKKAKDDDNIKGVYIAAENPQAGWATLEEVRNALIDFKTSKKFVYSYAEVMTEKAYYIASVADKIYLNPAGDMEWNGISAELTFFKGSLDKLGLKPEVFRVGEFKSAIEPFIRENMSEPNRLQVSSFLNSINDHFLTSVAKSRGVSAITLRQLASDLTIQTPADALRAKLVSNVGYYDELEGEIRKQLKLDEKKKIEFVTVGKYKNAASGDESDDDDKVSSKNRIAVIVASGDINTGSGDDQSIGSDKIAGEIRKARLNDNIKAIVLRINSGGGSALASDVMWREVQLTRKVKPIVASFSDYAASGGYFMAMGCNKIVAQPNTITGSIGVFALLFNTESLFKDKLGVTFDRVLTNPHADFPSATRPLTDFDRKVLQTGVDRIYASFTKKVADGRKLPIDSVRAIAGGRVWTGTQGKAIGLVDQLGGLDDAIKLAATEAKLKDDDYRLRYMPALESPVEQFMKYFGDSDDDTRLKAVLGTFAPAVQQVRKLQSLKGIQARLPMEMDIR